VFVLFLLTKLMGNREMSQLSMFDYIVSITIGSIAAEMATALDDDFMEPLLAMVVYALVTVVISFINNKSLFFRKIITGKSIILMDNGKIYKENFKKSKLDLNEFLVQCRTKGFFSLSDIQTAILEPNGKISILPSSLKRPSNPEDFNLQPQQDFIVTNVIIDGKILPKNLKSLDLDIDWLYKELNKQGFKNEKSIFLGTCDVNHNLSLYKKITTDNPQDNFSL
jgi:uncharacterized membrane protein YcaP (DUF421 family)